MDSHKDNNNRDNNNTVVSEQVTKTVINAIIVTLEYKHNQEWLVDKIKNLWDPFRSLQILKQFTQTQFFDKQQSNTPLRFVDFTRELTIKDFKEIKKFLSEKHVDERKIKLSIFLSSWQAKEINLLMLPSEMLKEIFSKLDWKTQDRFAFETCRKLSTLFQDEKLLFAVMRGKKAKAEEIFATPMVNGQCLALKKTSGAEYCGRQWHLVSPLIYAAWAGDIYIAKMFLEYIFKNLPNKYKYEALQQLRDLKQNGTEHGMPMAAYERLTLAYENYECEFSDPNSPRLDWKKIAGVWNVEIGGAQYQLPMYGLQEFFRKIPWNRETDFLKLPDVQRECKLDNSSFLSLATSGLGSACALAHEWEKVGDSAATLCTPSQNNHLRYHTRVSLTVVNNLITARKTGLLHLIAEYEQLIEIEPQIKPNHNL